MKRTLDLSDIQPAEGTPREISTKLKGALAILAFYSNKETFQENESYSTNASDILEYFEAFRLGHRLLDQCEAVWREIIEEEIQHHLNEITTLQIRQESDSAQPKNPFNILHFSGTVKEGKVIFKPENNGESVAKGLLTTDGQNRPIYFSVRTEADEEVARMHEDFKAELEQLETDQNELSAWSQETYARRQQLEGYINAIQQRFSTGGQE